MGISAQQYRVSTGIFINPGCPQPRKGFKFFQQFSSAYYHPSELMLLVGSLVSTMSTYMLILAIHFVLSQSWCMSIPTMSVPTYVTSNFELYVPLNIYFLSLLSFLSHFRFARLKWLTITFGTSISRRKNKSYTCCERIASFITFWTVSLNIVMIIISNSSLLNPGPRRNLTVLYHNVQGLVKLQELRKGSNDMLFDVDKIYELNSYIYEHHPDIIVLN